MIQNSTTPASRYSRRFSSSIAAPIPSRRRDELNDDRGDVDGRVGPTSESRPDHPIGPTASGRGAYVPLGERLIQGRPLRMFASILPEHRAELIIGRGLSFGRNWCHDENSADQLVSHAVIVFSDGIEFLGCHQHPRGFRAEDRRCARVDRVWAHDELVGKRGIPPAHYPGIQAMRSRASRARKSACSGVFSPC